MITHFKTVNNIKYYVLIQNKIKYSLLDQYLGLQ